MWSQWKNQSFPTCSSKASRYCTTKKALKLLRRYCVEKKRPSPSSYSFLISLFLMPNPNHLYTYLTEDHFRMNREDTTTRKKSSIRRSIDENKQAPEEDSSLPPTKPSPPFLLKHFKEFTTERRRTRQPFYSSSNNPSLKTKSS